MPDFNVSDLPQLTEEMREQMDRERDLETPLAKLIAAKAAAINPLIDPAGSDQETIRNAKCALTYLREWSPGENGAVIGKDIEHGRWLLLGVVELALEHALRGRDSAFCSE